LWLSITTHNMWSFCIVFSLFFLIFHPCCIAPHIYDFDDVPKSKYPRNKALELNNQLISWFYQSHPFFLTKVVDSLYLVFDRSRWLVTNTCKRSFFVEVDTLWYLNKYLFKERKYNKILERCSKKIYTIENEDCKLLF